MNPLSLLVAVAVTSVVFGQSMDDIWEDKELSSLTIEKNADAHFAESPSKTRGPKYIPSDDYVSVQMKTSKDTVFGKSPLDKIIGGSEAKYGEFPWQASVTFNNGTHSFFKCGASIINNLWILSAAHCFVGFDDQLSVTVGEYNLQIKDTDEVTFKVDKIYNHESYDTETTDNDLALLRINPGSDGKGISFGKFVQAIDLPSSSTSVPVGAPLVVSGWGGILRCVKCDKEPQEYATILKKTEVPAVDQDECKRLYSKNPITERMFCAGYMDGRTDACIGDSGGPLVYETSGSKVLVGVVSWGGGCGQKNSPGVFVRVSSFLDWIQGTIKSNTPYSHLVSFK